MRKELLVASNVILGLLWILYEDNNIAKLDYYALIFCVVEIISLLEIAKILTVNSKIKNIMRFISYSSMSAYLFHRLYYSLVIIILGRKLSLGIAVCFVLPLLIIGSWGIQKMYDILCRYHKI